MEERENGVEGWVTPNLPPFQSSNQESSRLVLDFNGAYGTSVDYGGID